MHGFPNPYYSDIYMIFEIKSRDANEKYRSSTPYIISFHICFLNYGQVSDTNNYPGLISIALNTCNISKPDTYHYDQRGWEGLNWREI